jgi:hypothetical protein
MFKIGALYLNLMAGKYFNNHIQIAGGKVVLAGNPLSINIIKTLCFYLQM